ncbi:hypothetical protein SRABI106_00035 [Rahnella aquatilis]|nr:hypothetical protein SRABI106_00035 [Rahnella aquatilis]
MKEIYIGEDLQIQNDDLVSITIGSEKTVIFAGDNCPANMKISTDGFKAGSYSIVIMKHGTFVSTELLKVKSPFIKENKNNQLREMINSIDSLITARMTNNEDAMQQMTINGKSFVYETLESLMIARSKFVKDLTNSLQADEIKKGKSPITTIKARFRNAGN